MWEPCGVSQWSDSGRCHHSRDQITDLSLECQLSGRLGYSCIKLLGSDQRCRSPHLLGQVQGSFQCQCLEVVGSSVISHRGENSVCSEEELLEGRQGRSSAPAAEAGLQCLGPGGKGECLHLSQPCCACNSLAKLHAGITRRRSWVQTKV